MCIHSNGIYGYKLNVCPYILHYIQLNVVNFGFRSLVREMNAPLFCILLLVDEKQVDHIKLIMNEKNGGKGHDNGACRKRVCVHACMKCVCVHACMHEVCVCVCVCLQSYQ